MSEATATGQQHPLKLYFAIWILLFVLSAASYATDLGKALDNHVILESANNTRQGHRPVQRLRGEIA